MTTERDDLDLYLQSTYVVNSNSKMIKDKAALLTEKCSSQEEKAKELFYFVRDEIRYSMHALHQLKDIVQAKHYRERKVIVFKKPWS